MKQERIARVLKNMERLDLSQILVSAPASVYYLTGQWIEPGERLVALVLCQDGRTQLVANRLFALDGNRLPLIEYDDTQDGVAALSQVIRPGVLGVDKSWPSQFLIRLMALRPDVTPRLGSQPVDEARMLKDAEELSALAASSRLNDQAVAALIDTLAPGQTELMVGRRYIALAEQLGSSGDGFAPLVCTGKHCAEPHHATGTTALETGDSVILDVGLNLNHALSDMTRTVFLGRVSDEQKRVYEAVLTANEAGRAAVAPGVPLREIDRAARGAIERAGYGDYFIHRTGHGIGLEVHEPPDVSASSEAVAQPGMVFSIEPGIYLPGRFGVRIEDLVAVTETGCMVLNQLDRSLRVV